MFHYTNKHVQELFIHLFKKREVFFFSKTATDIKLQLFVWHLLLDAGSS